MFKVHLYALSLLSSFPTIAGFANDQNILHLGNNNFTQYLNAENSTNGTYQLIEDITLPGAQSPIGSLERPLSLELNGNGHIISNINVTTHTDNTPTGLFGYLVDSRVHHLLLYQPYILSTGNGSPAGAVVGEMTNSSVTNVINYQGMVGTEGGKSGDRYSHAGSLVGIASGNSTISDNLNTGAVRTKGELTQAGGIAGVVLSSRISGNLNTGEICAAGDASATGGVVGLTEFFSTVSRNLNIGVVNTAEANARAGGLVGAALSNSTISGNLNTGEVSSNGFSAYSGGVSGQSLTSIVSDNLNTGVVDTKGRTAHAGGMAGLTTSTSIFSGNLNTGAVSTAGNTAEAGGVAGYALNSIFRNNLNTGEVSTKADAADAGGVVGQTEPSTVIDNLNTGAVSDG